jgi:hypothetical protein
MLHNNELKLIFDRISYMSIQKCDRSLLWFLLRPFGFIAHKALFGFPIFRFWAYTMNVIPEAYRGH